MAQIGEYEMDQVILDLGLDANVLPNQTWERWAGPYYNGPLFDYEWQTK